MVATSTAITNFDQDLNRLQELVDALEGYVLGNETYQTLMLARDKGYERSTISGGQLLSLMNYLLRGRAQLTAGQQNRLDGLVARAQQTMDTLREPFHQHLLREAHSHLDRLQWYLDSCQDDPEQCKRDFASEIQNRQRLEEISQALGSARPDELAHDLATIDEQLRAMSHEGDFVWPQRAKDLYPPQPYWYLYRTPVGE